MEMRVSDGGQNSFWGPCAVLGDSVGLPTLLSTSVEHLRHSESLHLSAVHPAR
jgi:hypothetical protein